MMGDFYVFRWKEVHQGAIWCKTPEEAERVKAQIEQDGPQNEFDADRTRESWEILSMKAAGGA